MYTATQTPSNKTLLPQAVEEQKDALFQCTRVFEENYKSDKKVNVNQGGTSSTKTYSLAQVCVFNSIYDNGSITTVVGEDMPALKAGAYRDFETLYKKSPFFRMHVAFWNRTDKTIFFTNGSIIEFKTYEGITDASSGKRDYLFVNEANSIEYEIYWQLAIRTRKKIYIDYNPTVQFWAHAELIGQENVKLIISDHRCNPFLTQAQHDEIENIKDPSRRRVYARGLTGNVDGLVYANWTKIPDSEFPEKEFAEKGFGGADFGYTIDPTAIIKAVRVGDCIYLKELCYKTGISAEKIKILLSTNGFTQKHPLYCEKDSDMIAQLRRLKIMALDARKGSGSVSAGILKMQQFKIFYTASSKNIYDEVTRYMWMKDPLTGKPVNKPIDKWNHLMDASRYGVYTHYFRSAA